MRRQEGFTLIEAMVVLGLAAVLVTLGAGSLRNYWLTQSLYGARDEAITQLRSLQEQAVSTSFPKVYGARFRPGSSVWSLLEYNSSGPSGTQCVEVDTVTFGTGVRPTSTTAFSSIDITAMCKTEHAGAGWGSDQFVFFFPRGTATSGTLTLEQPSLGRSLTLTVSSITGRVNQT